jgi:DNA polymerase
MENQGGLIDVIGDWETFFDKEYSLTKLMTPEYILDHRFEPIGISLSVNGSPPGWFSGDLAYLSNVLGKIPWHRARFIAHNNIFDGGILEWIFGYKPAEYFCTMMGSRPYVAPYTGSMSLAKVAEYLGLGAKGHEVQNALGKHRLDFAPYELARYGDYSCNDNHLSYRIYSHLMQFMPPEEIKLVDLTMKKFIRPRLTLDTHVIRNRLTDLEDKRKNVLAKAQLLNCSEEQLRSRTKFVKVLESYGVAVPQKRSARTGKLTAALAKDDEGMAELLTHADPRVRALAEAKIFTSSTMETKRLERFQNIYDLNVLDGRLLPVPLLYYGAHPGRFSGYDKINMQNLTRVKRDKLTKEITAGHLRFALKAPKGYVIIAADLSNIEARLVATVARCLHMVKAFREKRDLYCEFATRIYGRAISKADEVERFVGKTCILGLGYGMGAEKFGLQMKIARVRMAGDMPKRIVWLYRDSYPEIPELWRALEYYAHDMIGNGLRCVGPVTFAHERIILPNSMPIIYPGIRVDKGTNQLIFNSTRKSGVGVRSLWGGAITENIIQALARIIITNAELTLASAGLTTVLQVHDELVYCVPEKHADVIKNAIAKVMTRQVPWLPDLPVACEVGVGDSYGAAK